MKTSKLLYLPLLFLIFTATLPAHAQTASDPANLPQRDGSHDFDFLIGNWKAHVRRLPDRLNNSSVWVEYNGISNHKKLLDSNANFEEFDVITTDKTLRIKAQTLRLYNPASRQWSIYLIDLDNGTLASPPVVGHFTATRGEFSIRKTSKAVYKILLRSYQDHPFPPEISDSWQLPREDGSGRSRQTAAVKPTYPAGLARLGEQPRVAKEIHSPSVTSNLAPHSRLTS